MLVTSFEQACEIKGIDHVQFENKFDFLPEEHREALKSLAKIVIINDELNKDEKGNLWTPDWSNSSECKYELWFDMGSPSGSGFSYDVYDYWGAHSGVGSRLVYRNESTALHAQDHFLDLFKAWMVCDRSQK